MATSRINLVDANAVWAATYAVAMHRSLMANPLPTKRHVREMAEHAITVADVGTEAFCEFRREAEQHREAKRAKGEG